MPLDPSLLVVQATSAMCSPAWGRVSRIVAVSPASPVATVTATRLLSSLPRFSAHCHARSLLPTVVNHSTIYDENPDLHHGLLAISLNRERLLASLVQKAGQRGRAHCAFGLASNNRNGFLN